MFVLNVFRIVAHIIGVVIVHPLLIVSFVILAVLRHIWSASTDLIMFIIIKLLARTHNCATKIAWKISGPEMSRKYYDSLREEDIYILVQANL
jgi:hypothetical protein